MDMTYADHQMPLSTLRPYLRVLHAVTLIENYTEVQQDTLITEAKAQAGGQTLCCKQVSTIWHC